MDTFDNIRRLLSRKDGPDLPTAEEALKDAPPTAAKPGRSLYWIIGGLSCCSSQSDGQHLCE